MLVLSRKAGESIQIGENVRITVVDLGRGKVRLGVEAPRGVRVLRNELLAVDAAEAGPLHDPVGHLEYPARA